MIFFDLDGVIRDLSEEVWPGQVEEEWDKPAPDGRNIFDYINDNIDILLTSPQTKFCRVIRFFNPTILTSQPENWRINTTIWIKKNCPEYNKIIFVSKPEEKLNIVTKNDWLVDDYPLFPKELYNENILLIHHKYNENVSSKFRIKKASTLMQVLSKIKNQKGIYK